MGRLASSWWRKQGECMIEPPRGGRADWLGGRRTSKEQRGGTVSSQRSMRGTHSPMWRLECRLSRRWRSAAPSRTPKRQMNPIECVLILKDEPQLPLQGGKCCLLPLKQVKVHWVHFMSLVTGLVLLSHSGVW